MSLSLSLFSVSSPKWKNRRRRHPHFPSEMEGWLQTRPRYNLQYFSQNTKTTPTTTPTKAVASAAAAVTVATPAATAAATPVEWDDACV